MKERATKYKKYPKLEELKENGKDIKPKKEKKEKKPKPEKILFAKVSDVKKLINEAIGSLTTKFTKAVDLLEKKNKNSFSKIDNGLITVNQKTLIAVGRLDRDRRKFMARAEKMEETFLYIMHNIKKNQFLYAHYPEDWVKNYQDIKKGIKSENEFMDKEIKKKNATNCK